MKLNSRTAILAAFLLATATLVQAGTWQYTFTDELGIPGIDGQQIGFSFSEPNPLVIAQDSYLILRAADLDSLTIPQGDHFQYVQIRWYGPYPSTSLGVDFAYNYDPINGWSTDNAGFPMPNLSTPGVWGNEADLTGSFSVVDPPSATPEPASWALWLVGLGLSNILPIAKLRLRARTPRCN